MKMRTEELLLEWLMTNRDGRVKPRTYERYEGLIRHLILPKIGKIDAEALPRRDVEEFLFMKRKEIGRLGTLSATSVNLILTVIDLAFEFGVETGAVTLFHMEIKKRHGYRALLLRFLLLLWQHLGAS